MSPRMAKAYSASSIGFMKHLALRSLRIGLQTRNL